MIIYKRCDMGKLSYFKIKKMEADFQKDFGEAISELAMCYKKGFEKYKANDWHLRGYEHHIEHIRKHLDAFMKDPKNPEERYNLIHSATRCIMLLQSFHVDNFRLFSQDYIYDDTPGDDEFQF